MENNKQTAVEWLVSQLQNMKIGNNQLLINYEDLDSLHEQANQMFEDQIIDAVDYGPDYNRAKDYYNKTFNK